MFRVPEGVLHTGIPVAARRCKRTATAEPEA
jgi:hypothetical protein